MSEPVVGVSVLVHRDDEVLLVLRGRPPAQDEWAFPGGKVQPGERLVDAAAREVLEETGIRVTGLRRIDLAEIIDRDMAGSVRSHHVLIVFAGEAQTADIAAGDDAAEARWVLLLKAHRLPLTDDTARILAGLTGPAFR